MNKTYGCSLSDSFFSLSLLTYWDWVFRVVFVKPQQGSLKSKIMRHCSVYEIYSFHLHGLLISYTITTIICWFLCLDCCHTEPLAAFPLLWQEGIMCFPGRYVFMVCDVLSHMIPAYPDKYVSHVLLHVSGTSCVQGSRFSRSVHIFHSGFLTYNIKAAQL